MCDYVLSKENNAERNRLVELVDIESQLTSCGKKKSVSATHHPIRGTVLNLLAVEGQMYVGWISTVYSTVTIAYEL